MSPSWAPRTDSPETAAYSARYVKRPSQPESATLATRTVAGTANARLRITRPQPLPVLPDVVVLGLEPPVHAAEQTAGDEAVQCAPPLLHVRQRPLLGRVEV